MKKVFFAIVAMIVICCPLQANANSVSFDLLAYDASSGRVPSQYSSQIILILEIENDLDNNSFPRGRAFFENIKVRDLQNKTVSFEWVEGPEQFDLLNSNRSKSHYYVGTIELDVTSRNGLMISLEMVSTHSIAMDVSTVIPFNKRSTIVTRTPIQTVSPVAPQSRQSRKYGM